MEHKHLGKQLRDARNKIGLTQTELAFKCNLDVRTIQRIENDEVAPRLFTIRIISEALGIDINNSINIDDVDAQIYEYRRVFQKRKRIRIVTFSLAIFLMVFVALLGFPHWVLFGMPKKVWAPYFYLLIFAHIIGIVITWRCPACNSILGDVFNTKYCSKCGLKFFD